MQIELNGRTFSVAFLSGDPWYVEVKSPKTGLFRLIWYRKSNRPMGVLAHNAVQAARKLHENRR